MGIEKGGEKIEIALSKQQAKSFLYFANGMNANMIFAFC